MRRLPMAARLPVLLFLLAPATLAAQHAEPAATVIVVRHAEKSNDGADPPLSEAGTRRAESLATALADAGITTIITTPYRRTRDTAAPLAARLGLEPEIVEASGSTTTSIDAVVARLRRLPAGSAALVVGHSNTVPAIISGLGGPDIGDIEDDEYSLFFVVHLHPTGARLIRSRY